MGQPKHPKNIHEILAKFPKARRIKANEWQVPCPLPGHNTPDGHATITDAGDKALFYCFNVHQDKFYQGICDYIGFSSLKYQDNGYKFNRKERIDRNEHPHRKVATYRYTDAQHNELYIKERWQSDIPKDKVFYFKHLENGVYINGRGCDPVLYHLPEVSQVKAANRVIRKFEGEAKADAVMKLGLVSTSTDSGAGKRKDKPEVLEPLTGADVIIYADNDKVGIEYAEDTAQLLYGKARSIKIVMLPDVGEHGDIIDWLKLHIENAREELLRIEAETPEYQAPSENTSLPAITANNRQLRDISTEALKALYEFNNSQRSIFVRSAALTRISLDEDDEPFIDFVSESALRGYLSRSANYFKATKETEIQVPPPITVVRDIASLGKWDFPALIGITGSPVVRPDGSILNQPGYDKQTRLYYHPDRGQILDIPENPSSDKVQKAVDLINEVIIDFPFDSEASRSNFIATIMTPILSPMINDPKPGIIIDKPQAGTGASYLSRIINIIATGHDAAMLTAPKTEEEWQKVITIQIKKGLSVLIIDNVEDKLQSASLASLLTSRLFKGRILGFSDEVVMPNNMTVICNGNNVRLGGDLPRRFIWCRLDAQSARPWQRDKKIFKHPEIIKWTLENRVNIIAAILTIVRGWVNAGMPKVESPVNLGGYEAYSSIIGGVLNFMGIKGFLSNLDKMYDEVDQDTPQWSGFLQTWTDIVKENPVTSNELIEYLNKNPDFKAVLPDALSDMEVRNYGRRLGIALSKRKDMKFPNGLSLVTDGEYRRALKWKVVKATETKTHTKLASNVSLESLVQTTRISRRDDEVNILYREAVLQDSQNSQPASTGVSLATTGSDDILISKDLFPGDLLQLWVSEGRPIVYLGAGENCEDLEKLLSAVINERQRSAINNWYEEKKLKVIS
ncbi:hypothetical protein [Dehalococcoides mccartyi]|uniref:hypothetical protein n=1 Tax=Dehalococcoides mccartyi TaxID=61435 RepID=UPI002FCBA3E1